MRFMRDEYMTTKDAARELGVTRQRILDFINQHRLKAEKFANVYMIRRADLAAVANRINGRPPKDAQAAPKRAIKRAAKAPPKGATK